MVVTFPQHCLGRRIKYGNPERENATQQFFPTARPYCSIGFIESFWFWVFCYLFFIKVCVANVLLMLNYYKVRVDIIKKNHIYRTKQYQTFYRKIKCGLLNFRVVQNGYHQDFQYFMISIHFPPWEIAMTKKKIFDFFDGKTLLYP